MNTQGRKEVIEAVVITSLCAIATGFIGLGFELVKDKLFPQKPEPKPPVKEEPKEAPKEPVVAPNEISSK